MKHGETLVQYFTTDHIGIPICFYSFISYYLFFCNIVFNTFLIQLSYFLCAILLNTHLDPFLGVLCDILKGTSGFQWRPT